MSSFAIYMIGTLIIIAALATAATLLGAPPVWTGIGAAVILGIGIISAASSTREKDETEASQS